MSSPDESTQLKAGHPPAGKISILKVLCLHRIYLQANLFLKRILLRPKDVDNPYGKKL